MLVAFSYPVCTVCRKAIMRTPGGEELASGTFNTWGSPIRFGRHKCKVGTYEVVSAEEIHCRVEVGLLPKEW